MRTLIVLAALLSAGCSTLEKPAGMVMSTDRNFGKINFQPARLLYFPGDEVPGKRQIDYSLTMCAVFS